MDLAHAAIQLDARSRDELTAAMQEMQQAIEMLNEVKESIINAYEIRTGISRSKLSHMMDDTTWMNARKAIELGFADEILTDEKLAVDIPAYAFSGKDIEKALVNKITAKAAPKAAPAAAAPAEPEVKSGRSVDELMGRLNLMKY